MRRLLLLAALLLPLPALAQPVTLLGRYRTNTFDVGGAEIAAFDAPSRRLYLVNGATGDLDVVDASDPANPFFLSTIDLAPYGAAANSVAIANGVVAAGIEAAVKQDPGRVVFFSAATGAFLSQVTVGALPDAVAFSPDGARLVVACEGEPNAAYTVDPNGAIAVITIGAGGAAAVTQADVALLDFTAFNGQAAALRAAGVRIFGPGATVAQDLEPEYPAIAPDGLTAYVTLQENNAIAVVDLVAPAITAVRALGFKDHNVAGNGFDASDLNGGVISIVPRRIFGMYQPDAIAAYAAGGQTYLVTANEGDARDYAGLSEGKRVSTLALDPAAFPDAAALKANTSLGRLTVTNQLGDTDGDGDFDALYSFGARSFSVWRASDGALVYDSGDSFEQRLALIFPNTFNASSTNNTKQNRSDDKGPEPEGLALSTVGGRTFAYVGLERTGGTMVYDITDPAAPTFVTYATSRDFSQTPSLNNGGDLAPEGLLVIPAADSPTGAPLLVTANEVSGTVAFFRLEGALPVTLSAFEAAADGAGAVALRWTTEGEANNAGWTVEARAGEANAWAEAGFVAGAGTTLERRAYGFRTEALAPGRYAFRLRQVDHDGTAAYSAAVEAVVGAEALALLPGGANPARGHTTLAFVAPSAGTARVVVADALGREVAVVFAGEVEAGRVVRADLDAGALAPGVYLVRVLHGGRVASRMLVVAR